MIRALTGLWNQGRIGGALQAVDTGQPAQLRGNYHPLSHTKIITASQKDIILYNDINIQALVIVLSEGGLNSSQRRDTW
jgi:hypothetical protein